MPVAIGVTGERAPPPFLQREGQTFRQKREKRKIGKLKSKRTLKKRKKGIIKG